MKVLGIIVQVLLWCITILGAVGGVTFTVLALLNAEGAPQQAAAAAVGATACIAPYVVARSAEKLMPAEWQW